VPRRRRGHRHGAGTSRWSRALPGVAYRPGRRIDTHVTGLAMPNGVPAVTRWFYRQRMEACLTRTARPWFVLLEAAASRLERRAGRGIRRDVAVRCRDAHHRHRRSSAQAGEQTIRPDAACSFVAGAGWTKKQADGAPAPGEAES
jgi:electron transfer flavoprotein alpha subunit